MTADAPHPDPSLPPPMDAVGGADAPMAEGGMLTSAGADDGAAPSPSLDAEQAEGRWGDDALLDLPRLPNGKRRCSLRAKALRWRALWPEAALPRPFLKNSPEPRRWAPRAAAAASGAAKGRSGSPDLCFMRDPGANRAWWSTCLPPISAAFSGGAGRQTAGVLI